MQRIQGYPWGPPQVVPALSGARAPIPAQAHARREPEGKTRLQDEQDQEVGIGDALELLEEVERQEGEQVVLGGFN